MEKWMVAAKRADFKGIGERFGIDQVTARIIRNRDVIGEKAIEKYLHGSRKDFYSPWLLKDMEKAVAILQEKIENRNRIRIIGDYPEAELHVYAGVNLRMPVLPCGDAVERVKLRKDRPERAALM